MDVRKSLKRQIYERSYTKIQEAPVNACWIIKVATFVFLFFSEIIILWFHCSIYYFSKTYENKNLNFNMNNSNELYGFNNEKNNIKHNFFIYQLKNCLNKKGNNSQLFLNCNKYYEE